MANHGPGRTIPAQGEVGQVPVVTEDAQSGVGWGDAGDVAYTVDETTDWPSTDPTTIAAALDLLAARVTALETP